MKKFFNIKSVLLVLAVISIIALPLFMGSIAGASTLIGSLAIAPMFASSGVSPQQKIDKVARQFGLSHLSANQGTSRTIYDTIELTPGQEYYYFFQDCNSKTFPETNLQKGNKLEVGESLTVLWGYLNVFKTYNNEAREKQFENLELDDFAKILLGEFGFMIGNSNVIKPIRLMEWGTMYSKSSKHINNYGYTFNTILVIPELMEFIAPIRVVPFIASDIPSGQDNSKWYMQLTLEGVGSILSPRANF